MVKYESEKVSPHTRRRAGVDSFGVLGFGVPRSLASSCHRLSLDLLCCMHVMASSVSKGVIGN